MKDKKEKKIIQRTIVAMVPKCIVNFDDAMNKVGVDPDAAAVIFHQMYLAGKRMQNNRNYVPGVKRDERWRPVVQETLKTILNNSYKSTRETMVRIGWLEIRKNKRGRNGYCPKKYSYLFKLSESVYKSLSNYEPHTPRVLTNKFIKNGIIRQWKRSRKKLFTSLNNKSHLVLDVHIQTLSYLREFEVNVGAIDADCATKRLTKRDALNFKNEGLAYNQGDKDFATIDEYGRRLHYGITGMYKDVRPYLRLKRKPREPLTILDFKNSQPYLLSCLMMKPDLIWEFVPEFMSMAHILEARKKDASVKLFHYHCHQGTLYTWFAWLGGIVNDVNRPLTKTQKEKIKKQLFKLVLYNRPLDPDKVKKLTAKNKECVFANRHMKNFYNGPWTNIYLLKKRKESALPWFPKVPTKKGTSFAKMFSLPNCMAQRFESTIIFKVIARRAFAEGIKVLTVHDAFIVETRHSERMKQLIENFFKDEHGLFPPTIDIQHINKVRQ